MCMCNSPFIHGHLSNPRHYTQGTAHTHHTPRTPVKDSEERILRAVILYSSTPVLVVPAEIVRLIVKINDSRRERGERMEHIPTKEEFLS